MKAPAFRDDRDPPGKAIEAILRRPEVSSLQMSFREDRALAPAMPPSGFRVGGESLESGCGVAGARGPEGRIFPSPSSGLPSRLPGCRLGPTNNIA
jgi:hypothetical protein